MNGLDEVIAYCEQKELAIPEPADESVALQKAIEKGFPKNNHLLITTDVVDKRRSLYKAIKGPGCGDRLCGSQGRPPGG